MSYLKASKGIEDLAIRHKRSLLRLMYSQSKISDNINIREMNMSLRSSKKVNLKSKFTRLTKIQRSPYYRGLKLWDSIPGKLQNEQNRVKFKSSVNMLFK